eukprot:GHVR01053237.1.p1 GENE.GHVR01053237.1~~GHVR01053237.1.p1  ORF type:complete len:164 (+),score=40.14 GHVR01053237.1:18-509(+)
MSEVNKTKQENISTGEQVKDSVTCKEDNASSTDNGDISFSELMDIIFGPPVKVWRIINISTFIQFLLFTVGAYFPASVLLRRLSLGGCAITFIFFIITNSVFRILLKPTDAPKGTPVEELGDTISTGMLGTHTGVGLSNESTQTLSNGTRDTHERDKEYKKTQ